MIDQHARIACFSTVPTQTSDILMWAHYTHNHQGVRIGFEIPNSAKNFSIFPIKYRSDRVKLKTMELHDGLITEAIIKATEIKFKAWEYESEHRLLMAPQDAISKVKRGEEIDFLPFDRKWVKTVALGLRHENPAPIIHAVRKHCPWAKIYKTTIARQGFGLSYSLVKVT